MTTEFYYYHQEDELAEKTDPGDELYHVVCQCDEDTALCGLDVSDIPYTVDFIPEDDIVCVVCEDLAQRPCERCGYTPHE